MAEIAEWKGFLCHDARTFSLLHFQLIVVYILLFRNLFNIMNYIFYVNDDDEYKTIPTLSTSRRMLCGKSFNRKSRK